MNLAETAFGRFFVFYLGAGIAWGQTGFLMLRGYAEIVTLSDPTRCEVCKAWFGSGAGREVGGSRGDDFCVPAA